MEKKIFEHILFLLSEGVVIREEDFLSSFREHHPECLDPLEIFRNIYQLDYLKRFLRDTNIKEIIVHSNRHLQIEKTRGLKDVVIESLSPLTFKYSLEILAHKNNASWNFTEPYPSFFTKIYNLKFRATLVHPCTGIKNQAKLFLRRIGEKIFNFSDF